MPELFGFDCYSPKEIAERVENVGAAKSKLPLLSLVALGVLAGGFIGLGALYSTLVMSDPSLSFAASRLLGGLTFSLGLILVILAGAELFTGNNLLVMAWIAGRIDGRTFTKNLAVVFVSNFVGAVGLAAIVAMSGHWRMAGGAVGKAAVTLAAAKCTLPMSEAFFKGILCNVLVCLAVWIAIAGRNVADKILAIIFPVSAFVAAGFEHSVANMYLIPLGIFLRAEFSPGSIPDLEALTWAGFAWNMLPVTLGNLVGGAGMVGLVYYVIYRRNTPAAPSQLR